MRVIQEGNGKEIVYGELLSYFQVRGDDVDIPVPRLFVWTLGEAEEKGGVEGLQIQEMRLFMDTGIIGRYVTEKKRRELKKRQVELEVEVTSHKGAI